MRTFSSSKLTFLVLAFCATTVITASAQAFTTLYAFSDGYQPDSKLLQGIDGNFYGTTMFGGDIGRNCPNLNHGCGTLFKITSAGTLTYIHSFCSQPNCSDGLYPGGRLAQDIDGNLYGTTSVGGAHGLGTVFRITPDGVLTTLYTFSCFQGCTHGAIPTAGLIQASDGNFYGTTTGGDIECGSGCGTVFKITPSGTLTTLYEFGGGADGNYPTALVQGTDGNFYGTTLVNGANHGGTVFQITPTGTLTTLYSFCGQLNCHDGASPAGLVQATDGNFYGTTRAGGANQGPQCYYIVGGCGTVFKITPTGTLSTLYNFCAQPNCTDGFNPAASLTQATDGNFYGTTPYGGDDCFEPGIGCGTVFRITSTGTLTTLYRFCPIDYPCPDGDVPGVELTQGTEGNLYGTTSGGGFDDYGTIFSLGMGLAPFVETEPTSGGAGAPVIILGTNLTGATSVTFNGTAAVFNIVSPSEISTNVPPGASTGRVQVMTPRGTLTSNIDFQVTYALTISTTGNGTVTSTDGFISCPGTCSHSYPSNAQVTLNATAEQGWTFTGWDGACTGTGSCNLIMNHNISVGATFTQLDFTLTVSTIGNGMVTSTDGYIQCPGVCSHSYLSNTPVTLSASPAQGWTFVGWSGACTGTGPCNLTMTQNLSVAATFTQNPVYFTLNASINGSGRVTSTDGFINCPGTCSHSYLANTPVALNATPAQGWIFTGWSGACSGPGSCDLTMTQNLSVTASFTENPNALQFVPITPCRVVDTRNPDGQFGGPPITGESYRSFPIPSGGCGIPSSASAYSLNVTLVPIHHPVGYLTIWPTGESQPTVSTMNSLDGRVKANAAIVSAGASGAVSVFVTDTANVVLDIDGYFTAPSQSTLKFYTITPCRIADTRKNTYPQGLGQPHLSQFVARDFPVLNSPCIPQGITPAAYSLNFTAIPYPYLGNFLGYLEVWPKDQQPADPVSTLNNPTGTLVANAAIVPAGTNGEITAYASNNTDVAIDINGYFSAAGGGGLSLYPTVPCRVIDTRKVGNGQPFTGTLNPPVDVVNSPCGVPSTAQAYVFNTTVVPSPTLGYLTLWPDSEGQPVVSTLNAYDGWAARRTCPPRDPRRGVIDVCSGMGFPHFFLDGRVDCGSLAWRGCCVELSATSPHHRIYGGAFLNRSKRSTSVEGAWE